MCGMLLREGRAQPRQPIVDHVRPLRLRPDMATDPDNLRVVCPSCHSGTCAEIEARHGDDDEAIRAEKLMHCPDADFLDVGWRRRDMS